MGEQKITILRKRSADVVEIEGPRKVSKAEAQKYIAAIVDQFLSYVVSHPSNIDVSIEEGDRTTIVEIDFNPYDFGRVVGAKGKLIGALRTLVTAMAAAQGFRAIVRIKDEDRFF